MSFEWGDGWEAWEDCGGGFGRVGWRLVGAGYEWGFWERGLLGLSPSVLYRGDL